jgi:predicted membrane-bound mannosyltransferase
MVCRFLSALGLVLALAGIGIFVGVGVYSWTLRAEVDRQTGAMVERAHAAGDVAANIIALIREVIARAEAGLAAARAEAVSQPPTKTEDPLVRIAMAKAKRDRPQEVERARDAVGIASEAIVVAGAAIDVFEERPGNGSTLGIRPEDMQNARSQLDAAAGELRNARHVLGIPIPNADGSATPEQLTQVEDALSRARAVADQMDAALGEAREKVNLASDQVEKWTLRAALGTTALGGLAALGQFFMARACLRGIRRRRIN